MTKAIALPARNSKDLGQMMNLTLSKNMLVPWSLIALAAKQTLFLRPNVNLQHKT
jgi:hypothetical protein